MNARNEPALLAGITLALVLGLVSLGFMSQTDAAPYLEAVFLVILTGAPVATAFAVRSQVTPTARANAAVTEAALAPAPTLDELVTASDPDYLAAEWDALPDFATVPPEAIPPLDDLIDSDPFTTPDEEPAA